MLTSSTTYTSYMRCLQAAWCILNFFIVVVNFKILRFFEPCHSMLLITVKFRQFKPFPSLACDNRLVGVWRKLVRNHHIMRICYGMWMQRLGSVRQEAGLTGLTYSKSLIVGLLHHSLIAWAGLKHSSLDCDYSSFVRGSNWPSLVSLIAPISRLPVNLSSSRRQPQYWSASPFSRRSAPPRCAHFPSVHSILSTLRCIPRSTHPPSSLLSRVHRILAPHPLPHPPSTTSRRLSIPPLPYSDASIESVPRVHSALFILCHILCPPCPSCVRCQIRKGG